jgi:hypothetical protein
MELTVIVSIAVTMLSTSKSRLFNAIGQLFSQHLYKLPTKLRHACALVL